MGKVDSDSVSTDGEYKLTFLEGLARFESLWLNLRYGGKTGSIDPLRAKKAMRSKTPRS